MGRWFQKTTVGKTALSNLWLRHWSVGEAQPVITAAENDTGPSPAGHSSVSLGGSHNPTCAWRGRASSFCNGVSTQHKCYWGSATSTMWHKRGWTDQKSGSCLGGTTPQRKPEKELQKKKKKKERKGLHCKLLKRKNRKSSLANPCAIFSCPIIRVLSSWVLEPYITPQRLKKKKKKKCLERKSKLRFRVNRASWCFRLSFAASLETTTLGQGSDGMLPYWQWFNENTLLFKHFFCFLSIVFSPNFFFSPSRGWIQETNPECLHDGWCYRCRSSACQGNWLLLGVSLAYSSEERKRDIDGGDDAWRMPGPENTRPRATRRTHLIPSKGNGKQF